jgi:hypothetical protein
VIRPPCLPTLLTADSESAATNFEEFGSNGFQDVFVHDWMGPPLADDFLDAGASDAPATEPSDERLPRTCGVGKPAAPGGLPAPADDGPGGERTSLLLGLPATRLGCSIRPIPPGGQLFLICLADCMAKHASKCPPGSGTCQRVLEALCTAYCAHKHGRLPKRPNNDELLP